MPPMPAVSSGPQRPLLPAEKSIKAQLAEAFARMDTLDHYMFLGVPPSADESTIRQAYVGLAREYHPDRIAGTPLTDDTETRGHIEALFRRLSLANKTLTNAEQRLRYDRELKTAATSAGNGGAGGNTRQRRPTEARNAFVMAETYFKKKDFHQAEVHYRQAVMFDGDEPMIAVGLAWCIFLNPEHPEDQRREEAKKRLEEALKRFKSAEAAYKLGRVLRELGDEVGAMKRFEEAVRITPNHVDAQRELRIAGMRKHKGEDDKTDEKASLLGKLFKR
jgi:curved DNA-binding protein CbpA